MCLIRVGEYILDTDTLEFKKCSPWGEIYKDYTIFRLTDKTITIWNFYTRDMHYRNIKGIIYKEYLYSENIIYRFNIETLDYDFFYRLLPSEQMLERKNGILSGDNVKILKNDIFYNIGCTYDYKLLDDNIVCIPRENKWICSRIENNEIVEEISQRFTPLHFYNFIIAFDNATGEHVILKHDEIIPIDRSSVYHDSLGYTIEDNDLVVKDYSEHLSILPPK